MDYIKLGYEPRTLQKWLHVNFKRFNCVVAHRRKGKTFCGLNEIDMRSLICPRKNPHYAYIAPTYRQAKLIAWDYIKEFTSKIPGVRAFENDLKIEFPRPHMSDKVSIFLLGSENPLSIKGIYLDGAVIDEIAQCDPALYGEVVRPCLSDRLGWVLFIGTVAGMNHFYDIYQKYRALSKTDPKNYFTAMFKSSQTGIIPKEELELLKQEMSEEEFAQEYECDFFAGVKGAYFSKQMNRAYNEKRVCVVPYDPYALVDTFWDLGLSDHMAIWFRQRVGSEWHYIDYLEDSDKELGWYVKQVREKPYNYGKHVFPHDIKQRELSTNKTRLQALKKMNLGRIDVQKKSPKEDMIEASRRRINLSWFDEERCELGLERLRSYRKKFDKKTGVSLGPMHDAASDGADAFGYSALDERPGDLRVDLASYPRQSVNSYDEFARKSNYSIFSDANRLAALERFRRGG